MWMRNLLLWYLPAMNVLAFLLHALDDLLRRRGGRGVRPRVLCSLVTTFGGALGTLAAQCAWGGRMNKENAQSRMYTLVWLFWQAAMAAALYGPGHALIQTRFLEVGQRFMLLWVYLALINVVTLVAFAVDKIKAKLDKWRIPEAVLLTMACAGGSMGALLAMDLFHHKIHSMQFMYGVPAIMSAQMALMTVFLVGVI